MLDINLLRTNPELVKENIRKKFQDEKLVTGRRGRRAWTRNTASRDSAGGHPAQPDARLLSKQIGVPDGQGSEGRGRKGEGNRSPFSKADLEGLAAKEDELQAEITQADARHSEHH